MPPALVVVVLALPCIIFLNPTQLISRSPEESSDFPITIAHTVFQTTSAASSLRSLSENVELASLDQACAVPREMERTKSEQMMTEFVDDFMAAGTYLGEDHPLLQDLRDYNQGVYQYVSERVQARERYVLLRDFAIPAFVQRISAPLFDGKDLGDETVTILVRAIAGSIGLLTDTVDACQDAQSDVIHSVEALRDNTRTMKELALSTGSKKADAVWTYQDMLDLATEAEQQVRSIHQGMKYLGCYDRVLGYVQRDWLKFLDGRIITRHGIENFMETVSGWPKIHELD